MRKKIYSSIRFDPSYRTAYDQFFALRVLLAGFKFAHIDEIHQIYHVHDGHVSLVAGGDSKKREQSAKTHIRGYSSLIPFTRSSKEKYAIKKRLAEEWAWVMAIALREQGRHYDELKAMLKAVWLMPQDLRYWKTALASMYRCCNFNKVK
jgi:hypothetical protein